MWSSLQRIGRTVSRTSCSVAVPQTLHSRDRATDAQDEDVLRKVTSASATSLSRPRGVSCSWWSQQPRHHQRRPISPAIRKIKAIGRASSMMTAGTANTTSGNSNTSSRNSSTLRWALGVVEDSVPTTASHPDVPAPSAVTWGATRTRAVAGVIPGGFGTWAPEGNGTAAGYGCM